MNREWLCTGLVTFGATVLFFMGDSETVAVCGWMALGFGLLYIPYVIGTGRSAKRHRRGLFHESDAIAMHRIEIAIMTTSILVGVVGIEIAVRKAGGLWGDPWFIAFHLALVAGMVVMFVFARIVHTGVRSPDRHRYFAYAFVGFYSATLATGSILLEEKFKFFGSATRYVTVTSDGGKLK